MIIPRIPQLLLTYVVLLAFSSCQTTPAKPPEGKPEPPAKLSGTTVKESELTSIHLTEEAEKRLGIRVEEARAGKGSAQRNFAGEVTAPLSSTVLVSSPVAGTLQAMSGRFHQPGHRSGKIRLCSC